MTENTVIIDDDDDEEMVHINEKHMEIPPDNETIVLDEDSKSEDEVQTTNPDANTAEIIKTMSKEEKRFVNMLKSNNLMDKLVKLCLNLENAVGMPRVINKTLLPLYKDATQNFKSSPSFRKMLKQTLKRLQKDPDHKFLHVKTLCEVMKEGNVKRKVPFVTLATNLKHNHSAEDLDTALTSVSNSFHIDNAHEVNININTYNEQTEGKEIKMPRYTRSTAKTYYKKKRCKTTYGNIMSKKHRTAKTTEIDEVIDLDNSDTEPSNTLHNVEEKSNNHEENTDTLLVSNLQNEVSNKTEKENDAEVTLTNTKEKKSIPDKSSTSNDVNSNELETNSEDKNETLTGITDYDLLIPSTTLKVDLKKRANERKISQLEQLIDKYNKKIVELEEAEVTQFNDNALSPYVQCDKYKAALISCYKRLSKLTGCSEDIAKRREVRIMTGDGRLSGPAKLLQERLNKSIDKTGMVAFPDFCDVVECVHKYHEDNKCGWNPREMFKLATTLFKRCGEALRKIRQKHEYMYLLAWVPKKVDLDDPAEKDPQLLATLEENKLIAQAKEQEIMERYANMEDCMSPSYQSNTGLRTEFEECQDSSDSEDENTTTLQNYDSQGSTEITNQGPLRKVVNIPNSLSSISHFVNSLSDNSSPNHNSVTDHNKTNEAFSNVNSSNITVTNILQDNSKINSYRVMNNPSDWSQNKTVLQDHNPQSDISTFNKTGSLPPVLPGSNSPSNYVSNNSNDRYRIEEQNSEMPWPGPIKIENIVSRIEFTDSDDKSLKTELDDNVNIKSEPVDVQSMLDELGDSFVSTVFEIEDPFLVIEISSDESSDGES